MSAPSDKPRPDNNGEPDRDSVTVHPAGRAFPKTSRLLKTREFRRVYDEGIRSSSRLFTAFYLDTADPGRPTGARVGFTVPRAIGKAAVRNRIRRRIREAVRLDLPSFGAQWDVVVNPRRALADASFAEVRSEVRKLVGKCKPS